MDLDDEDDLDALSKSLGIFEQGKIHMPNADNYGFRNDSHGLTTLV